MQKWTTSHRGLSIVSLAVTLAALGGCSSSSVGPLAKNPGASIARPSWTSGGYTLTTVYDTAGANNEITGINTNGTIVGNYASSTTSDASWTSYTSTSPYQSFTVDTYSAVNGGAGGGTYLSSISNDSKIKVGTVYYPAGENYNWGAVENGGLWSLTSRVGDSSDCPVPTHELLGYDDNSGTQVAVGFYASGTSCVIKPYLVRPGNIVDLTRFKGGVIPSNFINTSATGIDYGDNIVGSTQFTSSGTKTKPPAGWLQLQSTTTKPNTLQPYWCCNTTSKVGYPTYFNGIALVKSADEIVGSYKNGTVTHGFVWVVGSPTWTTVDAPPGADLTVVNGVSRDGKICGWYHEIQTGHLYGFVGTPTTGLRKRH